MLWFKCRKFQECTLGFTFIPYRGSIDTVIFSSISSRSANPYLVASVPFFVNNRVSDHFQLSKKNVRTIYQSRYEVKPYGMKTDTGTLFLTLTSISGE